MTQNPLLIVDDEPSNLAAMRQILSDQYCLAFATSGAAAIIAAKKHAPSLILLDVEMPDMDGYKVCKALKDDSQTSDIPIIFVTARNDAFDEEYGFQVGAVDYITKPVSPSVVRARIATHLSLVRITLLEKSYRDALSMLSSAGTFNSLTAKKEIIGDIGINAYAIAKLAGLPDATCNMIELAARLHDVGNIGIPMSILQSTANPTEEDLAVMQNHTRIGYGILSKSDAPIFRLAAEIALHHHERWDGEGYPDHLKGEDIPIAARIVAIAGVIDPIVLDKIDTPSRPNARTAEILEQGKGSLFDPALVDLILNRNFVR